MKLLLTPKPLITESLRGYILRLSQMNGVIDTRQLLKLVGLSSGRYYDDASTYVFGKTSLSLLAEATDTPVRTLNALRYELNIKKTSTILGNDIGNKYIRLNYPRICPECLCSKNVALAIWDIPSITVCPIHKIELFDHCPECNTRLIWNRPGVNLCHACSCDYRDYKNIKLSHDQNRLSRLTYQLCMNETVNYKTIPTPLINLQLSEVVDLTSSLACIDYQFKDEFLLNHKPLSIKTVSNSLLHQHYCSVMNHLDNWPKNFYQFLTTSRLLRRENGNRYGISKEIGAPFYLIKANRHKRAYIMLWDAYCSYRKIETRNAAIRRLQKKNSADYISISQAANDLQIRPYQLHLFIKRLKIKTRKGSAASTLMSRSDITMLKQILNTLLTITQVSQRLGCTPYLIRLLIHNNIVTPFRGPTIDKSRDWYFQADVINDFQNRILNQCLTSGFTSSHQLSLKQTYHKLRYYKLGFPELIQAILDGNIIPARLINNLKLCDLKFSLFEIKKLRGQLHSNPDYWQPVEIGHYLDCKRHIVFGLIKSGQLSSEKITLSGRNRPVLASKISEVKKFHRIYILLQEIALKVEKPTQQTKRLLFQADIEPVSGPTIDDGYGWLYFRSSITASLIKRIKY